MTDKIIKKKEFGLYKMQASIMAVATNEGEITDEELVKARILLARENLKREFLIKRIYIDEISLVEQLDDYPVDKQLNVYLNPYYELEIVKNLKPFPIDMKNEEGLKYLNDFVTYLAMHLLYYRDFNKVLESVEDFNYTKTELEEAREILINYYDLEHPKTEEDDDNYLYHYPKRLVIKNAKEDVLNYELALVAKSLINTDDIEAIKKETGFNKEKTLSLLEKIALIQGDKLSTKAKEILEDK